MGNCSTPTCSGTIVVGQRPSSRASSTDIGEKKPWSSGLSWKYDRSNSSVTRLCAMCAASLGLPGTAGRSRAPPPSSATGNSSPMPSVNAE